MAKKSAFTSPKLVNPVIIGAKKTSTKNASGGGNGFKESKLDGEFKNVKPTSDGGVTNAKPPKGNVVKESTMNRPTLGFGKGFKNAPMVGGAIPNRPAVVEKKLTTKARKGLSDSSFVYPPTEKNPRGKYPIPDESHARNALSRVAANGTPAEKSKVRAAVKRKFPGIDVSNGKR